LRRAELAGVFLDLHGHVARLGLLAAILLRGAHHVAGGQGLAGVERNQVRRADHHLAAGPIDLAVAEDVDPYLPARHRVVDVDPAIAGGQGTEGAGCEQSHDAMLRLDVTLTIRMSCLPSALFAARVAPIRTARTD